MIRLKSLLLEFDLNATGELEKAKEIGTDILKKGTDILTGGGIKF